MWIYLRNVLFIGTGKPEYEGHEQQNWKTFAVPKKAASDYLEITIGLFLVAVVSAVAVLLISNYQSIIFFDLCLWAFSAIIAAIGLLITIVPNNKMLVRFFAIGLALVWMGCKFILNLF